MVRVEYKGKSIIQFARAVATVDLINLTRKYVIVVTRYF